MDSYLHKIASVFAREVGADKISEYTFVFPNRRAGLFFRKYLAACMPKPVLAPRIMTINECFYGLSPLRVADPLDLLFRVYAAYKQELETRRQSAEEFDKFLFWGKLILSDFSEIDNHLVANVKELFTTVRDLKEIDLKFDYLTDNQRNAIAEFWGDFLRGEKNTQQDSMGRQFVYIWDLLYPIYIRLRANLLSQGLAYDGMLHRELIEHWTDVDESLLASQYVFIGFNALTASEEQLMVLLQQRGIADFYFDYEDAHVRDDENRASLFMQHNLAMFHSRYTIPTTELQSQPEITHISIPSTIGEAHEVCGILEHLFDDTEPEPNYTRSAIVLPDERMLLSVLNAIPEKIHKVNVTMGYPLSATPVYALLELLQSLRARHTDAGFYHKDVVAVLQHRYIRQLMPDLSEQWLERIPKENLIYIPIDDEKIFDVQRGTIDYLRQVLTMLPDTDSEDIYLVETAINRIGEALLHHGALVGQIAEKTVFALITMMLSDQTIPYAGEPLEGLQVMGVLETRALDFDNVIITGFNDDLYPGNSRGNSFVAYTLRKGFGLPTPERQDAIFAYNFYRMIGHAQRVWLITNSRSDEQNSGEPSRYLAQLKYQYQTPIAEHVVVPPSNSTKPVSLCVQKTEPVLKRLLDYASVEGNRGFSPSALNSYLRCPLSFYWQYVMGVSEPEEVTEELQDNDLGTVMHAVLETLYQPLVDHEVTSSDIMMMQARVEELISQVASAKKIDLTILGQKVIQRFVTLILQQDMRVAPFRYIASERPVSMNLKLDDTQMVRLKGVIDRLDQQGLATRLVDYKSGNSELEYEDIPSLFDASLKDKRNKYALQTILYGIMSGIDNPEPHIYSARRFGADKWDTQVREKDMCEFNLPAVREEFLACLRNLIQQILNPSIPFLPTDDLRTCDTCSMRALCQR